MKPLLDRNKLTLTFISFMVGGFYTVKTYHNVIKWIVHSMMVCIVMSEDDQFQLIDELMSMLVSRKLQFYS